MRQNDFIQLKQQEWQRFRETVESSEASDEDDLPKMFRQLTHDLAIAKSRHYSPTLVSHLNQLLLLGQQKLYKPHNHILMPLMAFVTQTFPAQLTEFRWYVMWAHILFYGVALVFFGITFFDPEFVRNVLPNAQVVQLEEMYDVTAPRFEEERASDNDFVMFGYYIFNNISIAFQSFVGGLLLGFGALYILLFNALYFGVVSAHIVNIGYQTTFFSFVITHGAFELTAIVISAAAGSVIGFSLLSPKKLSRINAMKASARKVFPLIFGSFLMLVIAAFIEAFWSSSASIPNGVKYLVGGFCWIWVLLYVFKRSSNEN
ncbi:MAG: stage II sporulation protein M [Paraglaciecola sp.]|uniref:stage II sporulation protein M n=1 Tax=Paraglaciecola sp. TaxID=1920173 RepID=UPI003296D87B